MKLRSYLMSTAASVVYGTLCLLLTACENGRTSSGTHPSQSPATNQTQSNPNQQSQKSNETIVLVFNGFAGEPSTYQSNPLNLARDLSVVEPSNLYLYDRFIESIGTATTPTKVLAADYDRVLPGSNQQIKTGLTLLNPAFAMHKQSITTPSPKNPVLLSIPAGHAQRPEAPFFPGGTRYTAVIVEASNKPGETHGPILSLEAGDTPVQFAAFAHQEGKAFTLRTYTKTSMLDIAGIRPLLTVSQNPAIIQSRFVSLTADNLSTNTLSLLSMSMRDFETFGVSTGKSLLSMVPLVFPRLFDSEKKDTSFNEDYGVFCLGGKNTFQTVSLNDQTFVYPMSGKDKNTTIAILKVSKDSGIISESGKYAEVTALHGDGNLRLIAVMKDAAAAAPILKVGTLNGVSKINVVVGIVGSSFKLPATGLILLSSDSGLGGVKVNTEDAHMAGAFYDGETAIQGNNVVLTKLDKKSSLSAGSSAVRSLLAHDPRTQGLNARTMTTLIGALDPMTVAYLNLGDMSSALSRHTLALSGGSDASNHCKIHLTDSFNISVGTTLKHMVSGLHMDHGFAGLTLSSSVYGVQSTETKDTTFGASLTASKPLQFKVTRVVPSIAIGYDTIAFSGATLHANDIHVNLNDALANSAFARAMTNLSYRKPEGVSTSFGIGLEARHGIFSRGLASTDQTSVSITGESISGLFSVVEASFATQSSKVSVSLSNFNQFQIQFGLTD